MIFQLGKSKSGSDRPVESETIQRWRSASERPTVDEFVAVPGVATEKVDDSTDTPNKESAIELGPETMELSEKEPSLEESSANVEEAMPTRAGAVASLSSSAEKLFSAAFDRAKSVKSPERAQYDAPAWISDLVKKSAPLPSSNTRNSTTPVPARNFGEVKSALGVGTVIEGKLSFDQPVRIDGNLIGEIKSSSVLVVGEQAQVRANVNVGTLVILGSVSGSVSASEAVEVRRGGLLEADIRTGSLVIEEGGFFRGGCNR